MLNILMEDAWTVGKSDEYGCDVAMVKYWFVGVLVQRFTHVNADKLFRYKVKLDNTNIFKDALLGKYCNIQTQKF